MDINKVLENLCYYNKRNPNNIITDDEVKPSPTCFCDNCFNNRTELAEEILRLNNLMKY